MGHIMALDIEEKYFTHTKNIFFYFFYKTVYVLIKNITGVKKLLHEKYIYVSVTGKYHQEIKSSWCVLVVCDNLSLSLPFPN